MQRGLVVVDLAYSSFRCRWPGHRIGLDSFLFICASAGRILVGAAAVAWAVEKGVTSGSGDGATLSPDTPCTRDQIVTFLHRAAYAPAPAEQAESSQ